VGYEQIVYDVEGAVAWLRLNRPDRLNALTKTLSDESVDALRRAADNETVRAIVLTGEGRGFCAGQDLTEFGDVENLDIVTHLRESYHIFVTAIVEHPKPVLAAVNGVAAGAGFSLACAADVRIASTAASFIQAFIRIGLVPDSGSTWLLSRIVGPAKALELSITGDRVDAQDAERLGLVSAVAAPEGFDALVREQAQRLAALPTRAIGATKKLFADAPVLDFQEALEREAHAQDESTKTADFLEGVAAFLEKREARFTGR
jgi:2-(1,2-epoxy-1,2-dihydrophenyl)acetyl-CoA isomerase